jgi:hypothetical protein
LANLGPDGVVLVLRQSHGRQNADDGHDDHQLDQGETLLDTAFHKKLLLKKELEKVNRAPAGCA